MKGISSTPTSEFRLSVAAPAYNEGKGIEALVLHWQKVLSQHSAIAAFEIVICNDGSSDDTAFHLNRLAADYPQIRPLHFKQNQGAAAALTAAIAMTRFEWVLLLDADDQFPIENLFPMMEHQRATQAKAVMGVRQKKDHYFARFGTKASGFVCNLVHRSHLRDFNSACKLVHGPLLRALSLEARGMNYSTEVSSKLLESGCPLVEIDIEHRPRKMDKSKVQWVRDSLHRLGFVLYIALRQLLLKLTILRRAVDHENGF
jgi:dolichol-phosphate mannosyltransferase